jgi:hypothetical protein
MERDAMFGFVDAGLVRVPWWLLHPREGTPGACTSPYPMSLR